MYLLFGCPVLQISDMGGEFQNDIMRNIADLLGIKLNRTTAYRPSSIGAVERVHRTINAIFAKIIDVNQRNWCELTPNVTFAYNTSYHSCTTFSTFYLLYLREARIPIDLANENVGQAVPADWDEYVSEMRSQIEQNRHFKQFETNSVKPIRGLNRPTMAFKDATVQVNVLVLPQKTVSSGTEVVIINHGTLANCKISQLRQLRDSAGWRT